MSKNVENASVLSANRSALMKSRKISRLSSLFGLMLLGGLLAATIASRGSAQQTTQNPLTGNWAARNPSTDGYTRTSYFNLKQDGAKISGTIRATQFYYIIKESTGG